MPTYYGRQPAGLPLTPPDFSTFNPIPQHLMNGQMSGGGFGHKASNDLLQMVQPFNTWGNNQTQDQVYQQQMRYIQLQHQQQQRVSSFKVAPPGLIHPNHTRYQSMDSNNSLTLPLLKQRSSEQIFEDAIHKSKLIQQGTEHKSVPSKVEEKPVGGVSAILDYEMDDMAEFVASVASGMYADMCSSYSFFSTDTSTSVLPGLSQTQPSPSFKKFVFQILTSTRLPSSTILLGLDYLSTRMNMHSMNTEKNNQLYKVLTIALLLASKFLDDNTFQNRSWAEVTGLPVTELNTLEAEWLKAIGWNLHISYSSFDRWKVTWDTWLANKQAQAAILAPINSSIMNNRRHTMSFTPTQQAYIAQQVQVQASNPGFIGDRLRINTQNHQSSQLLNSSQSSSNNDSWWPTMVPSGEYSPPSAPETGPATPEWNLGVNWASHFVPHNTHTQQPQTNFSSRPLSQQFGLNHHQQQQHHVWGGQCNCSKCFGYPRRSMGCGYNLSTFAVAGYGQTVVG